MAELINRLGDKPVTEGKVTLPGIFLTAATPDYRKAETIGDIVYHEEYGAGRIIPMRDGTYGMETGVTFFNGSRVDCYIGIDGMDYLDLMPIEIGIKRLLDALEEAQKPYSHIEPIHLAALSRTEIIHNLRKVERELEEAQQQIKILKTEKALLEGDLGQANAYRHFESERTKESQSFHQQFTEAQQTIARQQSALNQINSLSYINNLAYSAIKAYVNWGLGEGEKTK
ncbi:hypothetical protein [Paenibacillus sinensis]|nr:hypothetical protein [Paenibacillus sinensis]